MCSDKDFQTFWFRYKTEVEPHGISINSFCINQGVPYKQFYAWFKKHAKLERAERMGCKEASSPMSLVRKLYKREDLYVEKGYDAEKITTSRWPSAVPSPWWAARTTASSTRPTSMPSKAPTPTP